VSAPSDEERAMSNPKTFTLPCGCRGWYETIDDAPAFVVEHCGDGKTHVLAELQRQGVA
jgi:hypothetical protein